MSHNIDPSPLSLKVDLLFLCSMRRIPYFTRSTRWILMIHVSTSRICILCTPRGGPLCLMLHEPDPKLILDALWGGSLCGFDCSFWSLFPTKSWLPPRGGTPRGPDPLLEMVGCLARSSFSSLNLLPSFVGSKKSLHLPRGGSLSS